MGHEIKRDCFAYDKFSCKCRALDQVYCVRENCRFYKTKEQYDRENGFFRRTSKRGL